MRGSKSTLQLDLTASFASLPDREELPPLAALFLIHFDTKAGYTISWKRALPEVSLDGVEFKSLPSGLHNLAEDLVYFVHGAHAGVSAFVNVAAGAEQRNALMLSVGILVPLSYGRLGRSWRHAEGLKLLAQQFAANPSSHALFEDYWTRHAASGTAPADVVSSPRARHLRGRSISGMGEIPVTPGAAPSAALNPSHPALSLEPFLDLFGPLVFPLYRAALARKRILLLTHPPVEPACNFVYDLSILSNIPSSVADLLAAEPNRLKPLFAVGVHDIPWLEELAKEQGEGWVACSTDDVLSMKTELWDLAVTLPHEYAKNAQKRVWPTVTTAAGVPVKATQRDLRRYRALRKSLKRRYHREERAVDDSEEEGNSVQAEEEEDEEEEEEEESGLEEVCEKLSWREIAYSGYLWWASAGEQRADSDEDADDLLGGPDLRAPYPPRRSMSAGPLHTEAEAAKDDEAPPMRRSRTSGTDADDLTPAQPHRRRSMRRASTTLATLARSAEMDIIAYLHRSTARMIVVLAAAAAAESREGEGDGEDERDRLVGEEEAMYVTLDDLDRMGLDRYSEEDVAWVKEVGERWFGRAVEVERWRISCCGIECG